MISKKIQYCLLILFIGLTLAGILVLNFYPAQISRSTHQAVTTNGEIISFNLYQPKNVNEPTPVVVIGHGIIVNKEMMTNFAIELAANGFIVASIDWSGHGQSTGPLANLTRDLDAVIAQIPLLQLYANMSALALLGYSMGGWPTYAEAVTNPNVKAWVGVGSIADGNLATNTTPRNVLMVIGRFDEGFAPEYAKIPMVNLTGSASVDYIQFEHLYGNISLGTARRIHVVQWCDHLITPWHRDVVTTATNWILDSFEKPVPPSYAFDLRNIFAWIGFLGIVGLTFTAASILADIFHIRKNIASEKVENPNPELMKTQSLLSFIGKYYLITFLLLPTLILFVPLLLFTPLPFTAALMMFIGCFGVNLLIYCWRLAKRSKLSLKTILRSNLTQKIPIWIYSLILTVIFFLGYYLTIGLNYLGIIPSITRLPYLILYPLLLFVIIFFSGIFVQKFATPFLEAKFKFKNPLVSYLSISLVIFLMVDSWFVILILVPCIILGNYFIAMVLILMIPIFLFMIFFSVYMEKLTGSIIPGALFHAIMIGFVVVTLSPYEYFLDFIHILF